MVEAKRRVALPPSEHAMNPSTSRKAYAAVCLVCLLGGVGVSTAQSIRKEVYVTDGWVSAVAEADNRVYIGGTFTHVGPATGSAVPIDMGTGKVVAIPEVSGTVYAIAADGLGGWYIGGWFNLVGGVYRSNLAQIKTDGTLSSWDPKVGGTVKVIVVSGTTVYIGGAFNCVGCSGPNIGVFRNNIAAIDAVTGTPTAWSPWAGDVRALAVDGPVVYVAGAFVSLGGQPRNCIGAVDVVTGVATPWNPNATGSSPLVSALQVRDGLVYAGGYFTSIGGQARNNIAALDAVTGHATGWNPDANSGVNALIVDGPTVYTGGSFTSVGGQPRNYIAAVDAVTGAATGWNPGVSTPGGTVQALALSGTTIYAGGHFLDLGGQPRRYIGAIDVTTGSATAWDPRANGTVHALSASGSIVMAAGYFTSMGVRTRNHIAALNVLTGRLTAWDPDADASVTSLAVSGPTVYASGPFSRIGGASRTYFAAVDAVTGLATSWNPNANWTAKSIVATDSVVYAGGAFTHIGGQTRNYIAALEASTGLATSWNPSANDTVNALVVSETTVYAGGAFSNIGGQTRYYIAALDRLAGSASSWNPIANNHVTALALRRSTVYVGGSFNGIGGQARYYIAALDALTGSATSWNPWSSSPVLTLAVSGSIVYAGGCFGAIGGQSRSNLAALDAATGSALPSWKPDPVWCVDAIATGGGTVFAGGRFSTVGGRPYPYFIGIREPVTANSQPAPEDHQSVTQQTGEAAEWTWVSPNPTRGLVLIGCDLPRESNLRVQVFDVMGRQIALLTDSLQPAGTFQATWSGEGVAGPVAAGSFFVRFESEELSATRRLVLVR
jgi:hypothetical protein